MNNRLYVGNLAFDTSEEAIQQAFSAYGEVTEVRLMLDRDSGRSRGFAFVTMSNGEDAQRAMSEANGSMLDGRPLRVDEAQERQPRFGGGGGGNGGGGGGGGRGGKGGRGGGGRSNRW